MRATGTVKTITMLLAAASLSACVSFGSEPPDQLMTLTPSAQVAAGAGARGAPADAIAVVGITAPRRLDVVRVPVQVDDSSVAYLEDAQWVEKPAILFERLLAETIRARSGKLVLEGPDAEFAAQTRLTGRLTEMGFDALTGSVIVRYDATLIMPSGEYRTRRFEKSVAGIAPEAAAVAPVLNDLANDVAAEVADWVG